MELFAAPAFSQESFHVAVQVRGIQKEPGGLLELLRQSSELREAPGLEWAWVCKEGKHERGGSGTE